VCVLKLEIERVISCVGYAGHARGLNALQVTGSPLPFLFPSLKEDINAGKKMEAMLLPFFER